LIDVTNGWRTSGMSGKIMSEEIKLNKKQWTSLRTRFDIIERKIDHILKILQEKQEPK